MAAPPPAPPPPDFGGAEPQVLWALPPSAVPATVGAMAVTPELQAAYRGHEALLGYRARHPPHCYDRFDQVRLCWLSLVDRAACARALEAYRPCAREMRKAKLKVYDDADAERRRALTEAAGRLASAAAGAGAGGSQ